jgi:hypothetical protein
LWNWLSPGDCTRLFEAALETTNPGFRLVWGVSANERGIMSLDEARAIGYVPLDNAEEFINDMSVWDAQAEMSRVLTSSVDPSLRQLLIREGLA